MFEHIIIEAGFPAPNKPISHNGFTRWGKGKRYFAKLIGNGVMYGDMHVSKQPNYYFDGKEPTEQQKWEIKKSHEEIELSRNQAALKAQKDFECFSKTGTSTYLKNKKVNGYGIGYSVGLIVIPLVDIEGCIKSYQKIYDDGYIPPKLLADNRNKDFLFGGKKSGNFHVIGSLEDVEIYVAEGYSTAASIHMATGKTCVVAFDAGNILSVIESILSKYPSIKITICGDDDKHKQGENKGRKCANEAAHKYKLPVFFPKFKDESTCPTDFNDLHCLEGIEAIVECLKKSPSDSWKNHLIPGKYSDELYPFPIDQKSEENAFQVTLNMFNYYSHDQFLGVDILSLRPKWSDKFEKRRIKDSDYSELKRNLEKVGIKATKQMVVDVVRDAANANIINRPLEYLNNIRWDGKPRIDTWLTYYFGAEDQNKEYLKAVGSKWLIGIVARILNPGCKFDTMPVLEGKQGISKSRALSVMAEMGGETYFTSIAGYINNKDTLMKFVGKILIEVAELSSMYKSDVNAMKDFLSTETDEYRPPYGINIIQRPRTSVFVGTTNDDKYLSDPTGNRRYWPIKCGSIDIDALREAKDQLYAEAVVRYKFGELLYLNQEEVILAEYEQNLRVKESPLHESISDICQHKDIVSIKEIYSELFLTTKDMNEIRDKHIRAALMKLGFTTVRIDNKRCWQRK